MEEYGKTDHSLCGYTPPEVCTGGGGDKVLKNAAPSFPPVLPRGEEVKADAAFPKQRAVHPSMLVHSHARDR